MEEERKIKQIKVKDTVYNALKDKAREQDITLDGAIEKAFILFVNSQSQE